MNSLDALAGVLRVRPGAPRPRSLTGTRPAWAGTIARGRPAHEVPRLLASLFSLCGHAHGLCAGLAVQAAQRGDVAPAFDDLRALQCETQREHIRRICLNWTRQLVPTPEAGERIAGLGLGALYACPALASGFDGGNMAAVARWMAQHLLGTDPGTWVANWSQDRWLWLAHWSQADKGWLAELLRSSRTFADLPVAGDTPLRPHADRSSLVEFAAGLRDAASASTHPLWRGGCAETGTWTRLHDADSPPCMTAWQRLGARVAELARLTLPDAATRGGAGWLSTGTLHLARREGMAWVEMSRGLLVHHVRLEGSGVQPRVASYGVLAPTEWNFHPQGAVARALEAMPPAGADERLRARVQALMAAYDPCVRFEVDADPLPTESAHA